MTAELLRQASQVDVLDLAGRIIANPDRAMCSQAGKLALAISVERMWEVCLEADQLARALERTMPWDRDADPQHQRRVADAVGYVRDLMAALCGRNIQIDNQES
jgi:hypothetical protein